MRQSCGIGGVFQAACRVVGRVDMVGPGTDNAHSRKLDMPIARQNKACGA